MLNHQKTRVPLDQHTFTQGDLRSSRRRFGQSLGGACASGRFDGDGGGRRGEKRIRPGEVTSGLVLELSAMVHKGGVAAPSGNGVTAPMAVVLEGKKREIRASTSMSRS